MSGLSPETRALIDAASDGDRPSSDDRARMRSALATKLGIGAVSAAASAAATKTAAAALIHAGTSTSATTSAAAASGASVGIGAGATATSAAAGAAGAVAAGAGVTGGASTGAAATGGAALALKVAGVLLATGLTASAAIAVVDDARAPGPPRPTTMPTALATPAPRTPASTSGSARGEGYESAATLAIPAAPLATEASIATSQREPPVTTAPTGTDARPTPAATTAPAATTDPQSTETVPATRANATPTAQEPTTRSEPAVASSPSTVGAEIALVRRAHVARMGGDPAGALRLLDEHVRDYPRGVLAEERDAERIASLCAMGAADRARTELASFTTAYPSSVFLSPIRQTCAVR